MATTREVSSDEPYSTEGDDEYDVYLFWPSLRRTECAFSTNEHSIYGVCSLFYPYVAWGWPSRFSQRVVCQSVVPSFDYDDYFDGSSYLPPSPLSFAGPSDFRFPNVADDGQPDAQSQVQSQSQSQSQSESQPATGYSKLFKMGLFLQVSYRVDRVWDRVRLIFQKARL